MTHPRFSTVIPACIVSARAAGILAALAIGFVSIVPGAAPASACDLADVRAAIAARDPEAVSRTAENALAFAPGSVSGRSDSSALSDSCRAALAELLIDGGYGPVASPIVNELVRARTARFGADDLRVAEAHDLATYLHWGADSLDAARTHRERAIEIRGSRLPGNAPVLGENLYELGYIFYTQNDYPRAAGAWERALIALESAESPDHETIVLCQSTLAEMKRLLGAHDEAEAILRRAIARSEARLEQNGDHARLLNNLAMHLWDRHRYDDAEVLLREALRISEGDTLVSVRRIANAYLNLGVLLRTQQKPEAAEPLLRRALATARQDDHPEPHDLVIFLVELGTLSSEQRRFDEARELWAEAESTLAALETPRPLYRGYVLRSAGIAHRDAGAVADAERYLEDALAVQTALLGPDHAEVALTLAALGETAHLRGRPADADSILSRAIALFERGRADGWLPTLEEAEAHARRAEYARARGDGARETRHLLAAIAIAEELRAQRGGDFRTSARFFADLSTLYDRLVARALDDGDGVAAFQYAERARARALQDQLLTAGLDFRAGIPAEKRDALEASERDARATISRIRRAITEHRSAWTGGSDGGRARADSLERELAVAVRALEAATNEIRLSSPAWARTRDARREAEPPHPDDIREELLHPGEILLVYRVGAESSALFVIGNEPDVFECHPLVRPPVTETTLLELLMPEDARDRDVVSGSVVARADRAARGVTGAAPLAGGDDAGNAAAVNAPQSGTVTTTDARFLALRAALVPAGVRARLADAKRACIVPDGPLHLVPFEALAEVDTAGRTRYWLDWGPVVQYAPSVAALRALTERARTRATSRTPGSSVDLLSVSDPRFANEQAAEHRGDAGPHDALTRLPGTAVESEAIARALGDSRTKCFTRGEATEARVREWAPHARYLHLATHGIVDQSRSDLLSALAFAPEDARDDGMLHLFEVYDLDLACELAVLSACDTRLGERIRGEGVFALARAFLVAGADRTIASLWQVSDASTAALMRDFFERVRADEAAGRAPDFARNLRDAKQTVRKRPDWAAPYYWAPFVIAGVR